MRTLTLSRLRDWQEEGTPFVLVDLLPADHYANQHLPGAVNCCAYQVSFVEDVRRLVCAASPQGQLATVVLYANGPENRACQDAEAKLAAAGFDQVHVFAGGLQEWTAAGLSTQGHGQKMPDDVAWKTQAHGSLAVDTAQSTITWFGKNRNITHHGTLGIVTGRLEFDSGVLKSGELLLDMKAIVNLNLSDPVLGAQLVAHLRSEDFFDAEKFPVAVVVVERAEPLEATPGRPNCRLFCTLELKGRILPLELPAILEMREDGFLIAEGHGEFDRTQWDVLYGSGRFYQCLGMHLVHDHVLFQVRLVVGRV